MPFYGGVGLQYDLMHKDESVAKLVIDESMGHIPKVVRICNKSLLPVGTVRGSFFDGNAFKSWWKARAIPASRSGIGYVLETLNILDATVLIEQCMGLSLTDHYWIKGQMSDVSWEDVNFFNNDFSETMGNLLLGAKDVSGEIDSFSPDNTTDGVLKKRWTIIDRKRCLIKGGNSPYEQEPFNEVIASMLMESQEIDHVEYSLIWNRTSPYSMCEDFINTNTELITAHNLYLSKTKSNNRSAYGHYCDVCRDSGIDIVPNLDRMLVVDYIMMNSDRHMNNFGLIRDADTLEFIGPAPIYDTGTSLGCNICTDRLPSGLNETAKPFEDTFSKQLKLVSDISWFDEGAMLSVLPEVELLLDEDEFIGEKRKQLLVETLERRIHDVSKMMDC